MRVLSAADPPGARVEFGLRRVLLACGVASSLLYVAMNVFVPLGYPGYSCASQTVSELSAIGAPTRPMWVALGAVYTMFLIAFGVGVWLSARESKALKLAGLATMIQGIIDPFWPPMHQRAVLAAGGGDLSDVLHIAFTAAWGSLSMVALICGAIALGGRFRLYSIVTLVALIGFGTLTGLDSPRMQANLSTPLIGVWERINIGAYMLWLAVLAIALIQRLEGRYVPGRSVSSTE